MQLENTPAIPRRRALFVSMLALAVVFILWNTPAFDGLLYPFRLFVTYVHEAGHSLMAVLTGGEIRGFAVSADGSGLAVTAGGNRALILPAGYLGAAFFGAVLFYLINTYHAPRTISIVLGALLIVFSVLFARPDRFGAPLALFVGVAFGAILMFLGWKVGRMFNLLLLNVLAMITGLNAVLDLWGLIQNIDAVVPAEGGRFGSGGFIRNDAAAFSAEVAPLIPPVVWAVLWAGLALLMLGAAVYYSIIRPFNRGEL